MTVKAIPKNIKATIGSAIGFYIAYLGFRNLGIGIFANGIGMGNFMEPAILIALLELILIAILTIYGVRDAILTDIITVAVMGTSLDVIILLDISIKMPDFSSQGNIVFSFDFGGLLSLQAIIYVFIVFCGDFSFTLGTVLGAAGKVDMLGEDGSMSGMPMSILKVPR